MAAHSMFGYVRFYSCDQTTPTVLCMVKWNISQIYQVRWFLEALPQIQYHLEVSKQDSVSIRNCWHTYSRLTGRSPKDPQAPAGLVLEAEDWIPWGEQGRSAETASASTTFFQPILIAGRPRDSAVFEH